MPQWAYISAVDGLFYTEKVVGSNPTAPTKKFESGLEKRLDKVNDRPYSMVNNDEVKNFDCQLGWLQRIVIDVSNIVQIVVTLRLGK